MKKYLNILAILFLTISSFAQSFTETKKSAEQGDVSAQYHLGKMYYKGEGTLTDKKQAKYWMKKSYENGYERAEKFWNDNELSKY